MDSATAAELKTVLVGVTLPATRSDLLEYAVQQHAEPQLLDGLRRLSDGTQYTSLDEVVAARVSLVRAACADSESRGLAIKKFLCSAALRLIPSSPKPDSRANRRR